MLELNLSWAIKQCELWNFSVRQFGMADIVHHARGLFSLFLQKNSTASLSENIKRCRLLPCAILASLSIFAFFSNIPSSNAQSAVCRVPCSCSSNAHNGTRNFITIQHAVTQLHIGNEFIDHRQSFWIGYFFYDHILPAMMMMTEQLVTTSMDQTMAVGAMLDAKQQLETQRLFQTMKARAHKDYQPSLEMCVIGTNAQSLAAAQERGKASAYVLSRIGMKRSLNNFETAASGGQEQDKASRLDLFKKQFCDQNDNGGQLTGLCKASAPVETRNMDVDYAGLVARPWTINADFFTGGAASDTNKSIVALYENLYGSDVFDPIAPGVLKKKENQDALLDMRQIIAKRAVAQNSFSRLIGEKIMGSADSANMQQYMALLMKESGIADDNEINKILGERPSYYAQMEMLTKQIFMRDQFYTNLYDTPANVARKGAAIQALDLVQNVDLFDSKLRNETLLATLVELQLDQEQKRVENRLNLSKPGDAAQKTP